MHEEHEPSDHYTMAQFIQQEARHKIERLAFMSTERSSAMAAHRYESLENLCVALRGHLTEEQEREVVDETMDSILHNLDMACLHYDGEETSQYFGYYIRDYANELIDACKRCMTPQEAEIWEANQ